MGSSTSPPPLVLVEGFLSIASRRLWGPVEDHLNVAGQRRQILIASVGPVSSLYDRACELFYGLKGGTVDYGEQHANEHGHERNGKAIVEGLYPSWSPSNPLHFLGHSMGGPTIIKLIQLLKQGHFGHEHTTDMVISVSCVSSPFRGTQLVYILGESVDSAPRVRRFSIGWFISIQVHLLSYLKPFLPLPFDFHDECRKITCRDIDLPSLLQQFCRSSWSESLDALPWDATFQSSEIRESAGEGMCESSIFYRSYEANLDNPAQDSISWFHRLNPFSYTARMIVKFTLDELHPKPTIAMHSSTNIFVNRNAIQSDGVVPLFSQWHPYSCSETDCRHSDFVEDQFSSSPLSMDVEPGVWHVRHVFGSNHLSFMPLWHGGTKQLVFWKEMGYWLKAIDQIMLQKDADSSKSGSRFPSSK